MYFNTLLPLYHSGVLNFLNQEPIDEYEHRLELIAGELNTEYVDGVLQSLAVLTPLMYKGARRPYFPNLRKEKIINTDEFRLVQKYYPDLAESEQLYLCLHLLGSRVAVPACDMFDNNADQSVYEITKALVAEFEKIACVIFEDREELERSLFVHINTSLYRYQYGIQIGNPLSDDIIREYPNLFDITKVVTRYLEQLVGLPIPDSEIAYLALHFGAHLKVSRPMADQLRILDRLYEWSFSGKYAAQGGTAAFALRQDRRCGGNGRCNESARNLRLSHFYRKSEKYCSLYHSTSDSDRYRPQGHPKSQTDRAEKAAG